MFFNRVRNRTQLNFVELAKHCHTHRRSFSDWSNGRYSIPEKIIRKLADLSNIEPSKAEIVPEYWYIRVAARKGAVERNKKYGNPGTKDGRSRGGKATCKMFLLNQSLAKRKRFITAKEVTYPKKSAYLAELVGILLGDGGITKYQVRVTHNSETDFGHAKYVARLFNRLFGIKAVITFSKHQKVCEVVVSSKKLVDFLVGLGLKVGNKIKNGADIPKWIKINKAFETACLRGLIDTDGCVYSEKHKYNSRVYTFPIVAFTNHSRLLFKSVKSALFNRGYHPTGKVKNILIRRADEVLRYSEDIGFQNKKHSKRLKEFLRQKMV